MTNPWIEHVKKYSREHNISYGCAISEAKASYVKKPKVPRKLSTQRKPVTASRGITLPMAEPAFATIIEPPKPRKVIRSRIVRYYKKK